MNENAQQHFPLDRERQLPHLIATSFRWGYRYRVAEYRKHQAILGENDFVPYESIDEEIQAIYQDTLSRAMQESSLPLLKHPLFQVPLKVDRLGDLYRVSEDEVREWLADFNTLHVVAEAALRRYMCFFVAYLQLAHVIWRGFHLVEVRPMLEAIVQVQPHEAETWFYLGQLYADDLGEMDSARRCFERYIELRPSYRPPNAYFLVEDSATHCAYEPCTQDAYTNLARIATIKPETHAEARTLFAQAIAVDPTHHLAPYALLAEFIIDQEQDYHQGYQLYALALANLLSTAWSSRGGSDSRHRHQQNAWITTRYPLTAGKSFLFLAERFEFIGAACYLQQGDSETAKRSLGIARRLRERFHLPPSIHLYETQITLAFHQGDYWQVQQLCRKILDFKASHQFALTSLQRCKSILGY